MMKIYHPQIGSLFLVKLIKVRDNQTTLMRQNCQTQTHDINSNKIIQHVTTDYYHFIHQSMLIMFY